MLTTNEREILIYYNPDSADDRKTVAFAQSAAPFVKSYAYAQAPLNITAWEQILGALEIDPKELIDKSNPYYQENLRGHDFDIDGWIKIFQHNPELIQAPIAIKGHHIVLCLHPTDIYKLTEPQVEV